MKNAVKQPSLKFIWNTRPYVGPSLHWIHQHADEQTNTTFLLLANCSPVTNGVTTWWDCVKDRSHLAASWNTDHLWLASVAGLAPPLCSVRDRATVTPGYSLVQGSLSNFSGPYFLHETAKRWEIETISCQSYMGITNTAQMTWQQRRAGSNSLPVWAV